MSSTDDGFVVQFTAAGVTKEGVSFRVSACVAAQTRDNRIIAIDEYVDSSQAAPLFAEIPGV